MFRVFVHFDGGWYPVGGMCETREEATVRMKNWLCFYSCLDPRGMKVEEVVNEELGYDSIFANDIPF